MRSILLCIAAALLTEWAQGQGQKDLEALWQMERLADQVAGRLTINTFTVFAGNEVVRIIFGTDTAYGRGGANALGAIIDRHTVRAWDAYAKECYADSTLTVSWGSPAHQEVYMDSTGRVEFPPVYTVPSLLVRTEEWTHRTPTFPGFIEWMRKQ